MPISKLLAVRFYQSVSCWPKYETRESFTSVRIWTPPRLQVIGLWQLARLHTYIRPLQMAYDDAGP
jgi:hypothetical protein